MASLYSFRYPEVLVDALHDKKFHGIAFLSWYWQTADFSWHPGEGKRAHDWKTRALLVMLAVAMAAQLLLGLWLVAFSLQYQLVAGWAFGLALIVSYPIVWASLLGTTTAVAEIFNIKRTGLAILCFIFEHQVRCLRKKYSFTVVAVTGSVGKTSSKLAIAKVLANERRVAYQLGNYNDRLMVPLVIFGSDRSGSLFDLLGWLKVMQRNQKIIKTGYPYDVAVVELGTDAPGQIAEFAYLKPDIAVVTAVSPEHMEFFGTLAAVAAEELSIAAFSEQLLINADDVAPDYRQRLATAKTYAVEAPADYTVDDNSTGDLKGQQITLHLHGAAHKFKIHYLGTQGAKIVLSAVAVADILGMEPRKIIAAVEQLEPFAGRMQVLTGKHDSTIIDDSYNASPLATEAALDVLYRAKAGKRIAILGSMNEMGESSQAAHEEVGAYCDPDKLAVVATVGAEANQYLAPAAIKRGCTVVQFTSPYDAGEWAVRQLQPGTVVLAKGSQNGVFVEEALKALLADPADEAKLVRQAPFWLARKRQQFPR